MSVKFICRRDLNQRIPTAPLMFWNGGRTKKKHYPVLSRMAQDILSIQASTVASESAFSQARLQIGDHRASMRENLDKSVLFRDWTRSERRNFGLAESQPEIAEAYEKLLAELAEDAASSGSGDEQASFPPPPMEIPPNLEGFTKFVFDWMQQNQKINVASYSSYVKLMGKSLSSVEALEMYKSIKDGSTKINVSVCNALLSCLVKNGKSESCLKLFTQMKRDGLVPDVVTYSTLLAGCAKVKDGYSKALELVQELMSNGLLMDGVTYGSLLSVCASHKECNEAEKYFQKMKAEGHSPNVYHYSSLLNAYSVDGNYEKAEALIEEMRSAGLVLNKVVYTTLLKVYVKGGLFEKSKELLKELEAFGYAKDEMPFCLLMDGLVKSGLLLEAKSVFDEMMGKHVKTDGYSYSIMISAFCRSGLLEDAKKLASEFEEKYDKYDVVILNAMLSAYCRAGEIENVMSMMKKMDDSAISPDWNTFNILIRYFCKEKLYLLAYRTMEDMHRKGHQPEEGLCSSLIYHLGKTDAHSEAFSVYNMLRYSKRTISKSLHEKILHILIAGRLLKDAYVVVKDNAGFISRPAIKRFAVSFMRSGNVNLINDVMKAMHSSGHRIDQELFNMAIARYVSKPEKKELLLQLLEWMSGQGYVIDSSTRNLILKNSHLFGHQLIAASLSKQLVVSRKVKPLKENAR